MIQSIRIKNFRNFSQREISFSWDKNIIIGKNGHGKTNILEALSLPSSPLVESRPEHLLRHGEEMFFVGYTLDSWAASVSFSQDGSKKKYLISQKSTTKQKLKEYYPHVISFHPMIMNMMYLGPSERRNFLDEILASSFPDYSKLLWQYKKIVTHRNKVLKNISEGKSQMHEIDFWDSKFLIASELVYSYRNKIVTFLEEHIESLQKYFFWKISSIEFSYLTKVDMKDVKHSLESYIRENKQKEILLRKTLRWPHLDDFQILVNGTNLIHFASRGEVKSIILWLKFLETDFIRTHSSKEWILFLIDDLLSELDSDHRELLLDHISWYQSIMSSIEDFNIDAQKIYL